MKKPSETSPKRRRRSAASSALRRGQPPGAGGYMGEGRDEPVRVAVMEYGPGGYEEGGSATAPELARMRTAAGIAWVDLDGLHDREAIDAVCAAFDVHVLQREDLLNPTSRPKVEDLGDHVFVIAKALRATAPGEPLHIEQISLVLGPGWVLTFQERPGDPFDAVRRRIRDGAGRIRGMGADYLLHALLDAIVDDWFATADAFELQVEALESRAHDEPGAGLVAEVHALRSELAIARRLVWPLRGLSADLARAEGRVLHPRTAPYFRDLHDHILQVLDLLDGSSERTRGVLDLHLALTSHRMNEVMRLLTVVSTVFIPLGFLTGLYGMNFAAMPELGWRWGYPALWVLMLAIVGGLLVAFRRRGWL